MSIWATGGYGCDTQKKTWIDRSEWKIVMNSPSACVGQNSIEIHDRRTSSWEKFIFYIPQAMYSGITTCGICWYYRGITGWRCGVEILAHYLQTQMNKKDGLFCVVTVVGNEAAGSSRVDDRAIQSYSCQFDSSFWKKLWLPV